MDIPDRGLARTARAALVLAVALLPGAVPREHPVAPECRSPVSAAEHEGRTLALRCDAGPGPPLQGPARLLFGQRLDPNTADAASLAVLPGLGLGKAEAIVRERARAPFTRPEDLERVPGIGAATLERLRPWLEFGSAPRAAAQAVDPGGRWK